MKKIAIFLSFVLAIVGGTNFYFGIFAEKEYKKIVENLKTNGIEISNFNYEKSFFESKASFDGRYILKENNINFSVKSDILHNFFKIHSTSYINNVNYARIFKQPNFAKIIFDKTLFSKENFKFYLTDIKNDDFKLQDAKIDFDANDLNIKNLTLNIKNFSFKSDDSDISLNDLTYHIKFLNPIKLQEIMSKIDDQNVNFTLDNLEILSDDLNFKIENLKSNASVKTKEQKLNFEDNYTIQKIQLWDNEILDTKFNIELLNVDKISMQNLYKNLTDENQILENFKKIFSENIIFNVKNLSFLNANNEKFALNLNIQTPKIAQDTQIFEFISKITDNLKLSGEIKTNFSNIFDLNVDRIFIDQNGMKISKFKYDPQKFSIIFNDEISLNEILDSSKSEFNQTKQDLEILIEDLTMFYQKNGEFAQNISTMTNVLVVDILPTKATLFTGDLDCINLEIFEQNSKGFLKISKGIDLNETECIEIYKDNFVQDLLNLKNIELK